MPVTPGNPGSPSTPCKTKEENIIQSQITSLRKKPCLAHFNERIKAKNPYSPAYREISQKWGEGAYAGEYGIYKKSNIPVHFAKELVSS